MSMEVWEATQNHATSRRSRGERQKLLAARHLIPVTALGENVHLGTILSLFLITMWILSRWHRVSRDEQEKTLALIVADKSLKG